MVTYWRGADWESDTGRAPQAAASYGKAFTENIMNRALDTNTIVQKNMRRGLFAGAVVVLLVVSTEADAADSRHQNTVEITPFAGQMGGGKFEDPTDSSDRDVEGKSNWGVFLNFNADGPERQYEIFYTRQSTEVDGIAPLDMDIQYLHVGGVVNFTDNKPVVPYFGLTVGATKFSPDATGLDDETKLSFSAGTGVKYLFTDHFGIRFDARAYVTLLDSESDIFCVSAPASGSGCRIRASSDTFFQYSASLGIVAAF